MRRQQPPLSWRSKYQSEQYPPSMSSVSPSAYAHATRALWGSCWLLLSMSLHTPLDRCAHVGLLLVVKSAWGERNMLKSQLCLSRA